MLEVPFTILPFLVQHALCINTSFARTERAKRFFPRLILHTPQRKSSKETDVYFFLLGIKYTVHKELRGVGSQPRAFPTGQFVLIIKDRFWVDTHQINDKHSKRKLSLLRKNLKFKIPTFFIVKTRIMGLQRKNT